MATSWLGRRGPAPLRVGAIGLGLALVSSGCGARWSDQQRAAVLARQQGGPLQAAAARPGPAGAVDTATDAGPAVDAGGASGSAGSAAAAPAGGGAPDQAAATTGGGGSGPAPCAAPSNAPGVSDKEIRVGTISSLSGPVPGLGSSAAGATRSYVAYLNSKGGVCGRRIVLKEADDGTDNGRYRSIVSEMNNQVFGIAGGFAMGDVGGIDVLRQTKIPLVSVTGADEVTAVPNVFDINPIYENLDAPIGKYRFLREQGATKASVTYLAADQSRAEAQKQQRLMKAAGIQVVQVQELPVSTLSYDSAARAVANSGADYLFFIGPTDANASMARSLADTGYKLKVSEYFTYSYATKFVEQAGAAAEGASTFLRTLPNEDAGQNPEVATYLQWMARVAPREPRDSFAADAWAGTKAFFEALANLPGPISRDAFVAQLRSMQRYDAGGMLGPINLGAKTQKGCTVGLRVEGGKWKRWGAPSGFLC